MKNFLKRLFIYLPLCSIWLLASFTIVIPIVALLITGDIDDWVAIPEKITNL